MMEDEIMMVNNINFSLRKILKEKGWKTYCKTSEKVRELARLKIRMDLSAMEIEFEKIRRLELKNPKEMIK